MIEKLSLVNFRNIQSATLSFGENTNLVTGRNGAGKTSLLEAIFLLSRGRSFLTRGVRNLVREGSASSTLFCQVFNESSSIHHRIGIELKAGENKMVLDNVVLKSRRDLWSTLPVHIISANSFELLLSSPRFRRQFLDWGMFHVEHTVLDHLAAYNRILKQRNSALKQFRNSARSWDDQLIEHGNILHRSRLAYIEQLRLIMDRKLAHFPDLPRIRLWYHNGFSDRDSAVSLDCSVRDSFQSDVIRGFTQKGTHRADLGFEIDGGNAKTRLSRGQVKLVTITMILAQLEIRSDAQSCRPVLLLDDIQSELDSINVDRLYSLLSSVDCQKIITAIDKPLVNMPIQEMFHVEHGAIEKVTA